MKIHCDDVFGRRKDAIGLGGIPETCIDQDIVANLVPDRRGARLHGVFGVDDAGQRLILDCHRFGGVERLRAGFGNDHRDRFADVAHLVGRQQDMRADEDLAAAGPMQFHVVFRLRQRIVRDGAELVGKTIGAGKDAENAGHVPARRSCRSATMRACACGERTIAA